MKVEPKHYDVGNIIMQESVPIGLKMLLPELHNQLSKVGAQLMLKSLVNIHELLETSTAQPLEGVTYAPKVEGHALSYINWDTMNAQEVFNLFRSLYGFRPTLTLFDNHIVKLLDMEIVNFSFPLDSPQHHIKGAFLFDRPSNSILVNCSENTCVAIKSLQIMGKKPITAVQFLNGFVKKRPESEWIFNKVEISS